MINTNTNFALIKQTIKSRFSERLIKKKKKANMSIKVNETKCFRLNSKKVLEIPKNQIEVEDGGHSFSDTRSKSLEKLVINTLKLGYSL